MENELSGIAINLTTKDGYVISAYCWDKVENPRAVLQIFHGMAEHAGRYDRLAKYLNTQGIVVFGDDHRGHGKTSQLNGKLGVIGKNGFYNIVEDEYMITKMLKEKYPHIPIYILAHSFGSFIGQEYITKYGSQINGLILSGSAAQIGVEFKFAKILAAIQIKFFGEEKEAKLLDKLSFGSYNNKINNPVTEFDWLSYDAVEVKKYIDDEYCGFIWFFLTFGYITSPNSLEYSFISRKSEESHITHILT
ncbi:MAG TPA: alpha/beta fold hydrolase [Ruminiclostridium sp.]